MCHIALHVCRLSRRTHEHHPMSDTLARLIAAVSDGYRVTRELGAGGFKGQSR